ncbi:MAG TPA: hypothetical protein ENH37_08275 [Deltaproteobacteria bacterium]|nr:hypothetical protein [Deltaproteobacteria bacterium]
MMRGKISAIDITESHVTAVRLRAGLKGYQVFACARVPVPEEGLNGALGSLGRAVDLKGDTCSVTIPEGHVSFRNLRIPFKDKKKIRQALPFEMETMLPFQAEDIVADCTMTHSPDLDEIVAASCNRDFIGEYLSVLQQNGIDPDVIEVRGSALASWQMRQPGTPEHMLLLEIGERNSTLVLCMNRRIVLIRSFPFDSLPIMGSIQGQDNFRATQGPPPQGAVASLDLLCSTVKNTTHAFLSRRQGLPDPEILFFTGPGALYPGMGEILARSLNVPVEEIDVTEDKKVRIGPEVLGTWSPPLMNSALALALRDNRRDGGFNFRRGEFERTKGYLGLKRAWPGMAVFLFLILALLTADMLVDYHNLKKEYASLTRQITSIFRETLPEVTRIVDPVQQLRVKIQELRRSTSLRPEAGTDKRVLGLLKEISRLIPNSLSVRIDRMVIDTETMRMRGKTEAFNQVDQVKNSLEASGRFNRVVISSANLDRKGKGVSFEIRVDLKGTGK